MLRSRLHSRAGFTLVELLIAMTIMGIMGVMTMMIYFNVSESSRRLQISRELSETAREITERIAQDVQDRGIYRDNISSSFYRWRANGVSDYTENGSEVLAIGHTGDTTPSAELYYIYGKREPTGLAPCTDADKDNIMVHCGLYLATSEDRSRGYNLVDSFRADDDQKRIKISDLSFYITGDDTNAPKVTLKMTLELMPRAGVPASLSRATKLEIQSTFSERFYKMN